jgi:preprotein translocase subunit YajC
MEALGQFLPLLLLFGVFYFLLLRPQRARQRAQQALIDSVSKGDRIVTIGGFHGTVQSVDEDTIRLELAPGAVATVSRAAIARRLVDADTGEDEGGATAAE